MKNNLNLVIIYNMTACCTTQIAASATNKSTNRYGKHYPILYHIVPTTSKMNYTFSLLID